MATDSAGAPAEEERAADPISGGSAATPPPAPMIIDWERGRVTIDDRVVQYMPRDLTKKERADVEAQLRAAEPGIRKGLERQIQVESERNKAEAKAVETLRGYLSPTQRSDMDEHGSFTFEGSRGTRWRVHTNQGISGNVHWLNEKGKVGGSFCVHAESVDRLAESKGRLYRRIPSADHHLAQMLGLKADEDAVMAVAILTGGKWPPGCPTTSNARAFRLMEALADF